MDRRIESPIRTDSHYHHSRHTILCCSFSVAPYVRFHGERPAERLCPAPEAPTAVSVAAPSSFARRDCRVTAPILRGRRRTVGDKP